MGLDTDEYPPLGEWKSIYNYYKLKLNHTGLKKKHLVVKLCGQSLHSTEEIGWVVKINGM